MPKDASALLRLFCILGNLFFGALKFSVIFFALAVGLLEALRFLFPDPLILDSPTSTRGLLRVSSADDNDRGPTELRHLVFGIASSANNWQRRKRFVDLWWEPGATRGFVWLDRLPNRTVGASPPAAEAAQATPPLRVSEDTSRFKFTHPHGPRSAIRVARIVTESFRLALPGVRWFVLGDDDTVFFTQNLVKVLSKYDHTQYYYVGANSESVMQNFAHSFRMAFGGGGFAISYPLAKALAATLDECIDRYPALYGSDHRIQACASELGVPLTSEPGFHQVDLRGSLVGLLMAHPLAPAVSLHHLESVDAVFPNMRREDALEHLMAAASFDPPRILQHSICYFAPRYWTLSVSWGYAVQLYERLEAPGNLERPLQTFTTWNRARSPFMFNTRPPAKRPWDRPKTFYLSYIDEMLSRYSLHEDSTDGGFRSVANVTVVAPAQPIDWSKAPRRQCCDVMSYDQRNLEVLIRDCRDGESILSALSRTSRYHL